MNWNRNSKEKTFLENIETDDPKSWKLTIKTVYLVQQDTN